VFLGVVVGCGWYFSNFLPGVVVLKLLDDIHSTFEVTFWLPSVFVVVVTHPLDKILLDC
jgi:hypothetical protein